jgi:hypothetical protein
MTFAIHDNTIYGYSILADDDGKLTYTIRLYTKFHQTAQPSFTDIVFSGAIAHYFEDYLAHNILFDIEEITIEACFDEYHELFEYRVKYGWPFPHNGKQDLLQRAHSHQVIGYQINTSYGLNGWIWARTMDIIKRQNEAQLENT